MDIALNSYLSKHRHTKLASSNRLLMTIQCKASNWNNAGSLSIGPLRPNLSDIWVKLHYITPKLVSGLQSLTASLSEQTSKSI